MNTNTLRANLHRRCNVHLRNGPVIINVTIIRLEKDEFNDRLYVYLSSGERILHENIIWLQMIAEWQIENVSSE